MVASDRISAYDVVLPTVIPYKGLVLSKLSEYWFNNTNHLIPNHLICLGDNETEISKINTVVPLDLFPPEVLSKGMVVKKANRIDIECVVRGYITGSAWSEYQKTGTVSGIKMPSGMKEGDPFPEPLFTPTTKAETGHDLPMTMDEVRDMVGSEMADRLEAVTTEIYMYAHDESEIKGIIVADTKMEFGFIGDNLILIDELLTPDSSRFWEADKYVPGNSLPNYDKQLVRNWLESSGWDKESTPPNLPSYVIENTINRYTEVYQLLSQ